MIIILMYTDTYQLHNFFLIGTDNSLYKES